MNMSTFMTYRPKINAATYIFKECLSGILVPHNFCYAEVSYISCYEPVK